MALESPQISAIVVQDADGGRIAAKFYSRDDFPDKVAEAEFEKKLYKKMKAAPARSDAEVLTLEGLTVVYRQGGDVTFAVVGQGDENELILVACLDALYDALSMLLKGNIEKLAVLRHLELLLLTIDELIDGGVPFELDPNAIEARVMLRGAVPESVSSYNELTIGAVVDKARDKLAKQFIK